MRKKLKSRIATRFLFGLCTFAAASGVSVIAAGAQTTRTASVNAPEPQKPTDWRKLKIKEPVTSIGCNSARRPGKPYFVEFRSRTAASYGHTFVFYGQLGSGPRFASYKVAGLHPAGDDPDIYLKGHVIPVPAETGVSWGDTDEQYLTARFCVALNAAEYNKMVAQIRKLQAEKKTWLAVGYNCNSFGADIAKHIGLDTPNPNLYLPEMFVKRLADLNSKK